MKRSEKNKINHLSIVFSGMSSVSLGWEVGEVGRGSGEHPLVSFSHKVAEGHSGDSGERTRRWKSPGGQGAAAPGAQGAVRALHGAAGPSGGLHSWLQGEREEGGCGWGPGLRPTSRGQG